MFLNIEQKKKEKVKVMLANKFSKQTVVSELYSVIVELQNRNYTMKEISTILEMELEVSVKPNTLYKLVDKVKKEVKEFESDRLCINDEIVKEYNENEDAFVIPILNFEKEF